jgi:hypothetical protein
VSARQAKVGEFYWGYGSGVVVAKVAGFGEFVLAELTQPFDQADVSYFFPVMQQAEARLGYRPRYATFDAAFDAWYVYAYFYRKNDPDYGFAAVPFSEKGNYKANQRQFAANGWPLCAAGLTMPLKFTFTDRTSCLIEHERGKYVCPLVANAPAQQGCPIHHQRWKKGGCTVMTPALAAQVQVCPPAWARAFATPSIATANSTNITFVSARPSNASIHKLWHSASSARICATAQRLPTRTR